MTEPEISMLNLLERCKNGEPAAQKKLYEDHYVMAMSICLRYCQTKEEAHEVVNDGFLNMFKNLKSFKPSLSFKSWFNRILINASIDFYRNQQKHYYHLDIESAHLVSSNSNAPDSNLRIEDLMDLLKELPNSYRINFNLFAIEGYSHQDISEIMNISINTSKSNVSRARGILRDKVAAITNGVIN